MSECDCTCIVLVKLQCSVSSPTTKQYRKKLIEAIIAQYKTYVKIYFVSSNLVNTLYIVHMADFLLSIPNVSSIIVVYAIYGTWYHIHSH